MSRRSTFVFCLIWLVFTCVFAALALQAKRAESTTLNRVLFDAPKSEIIRIDGFGVRDTLVLIAKTNNENISRLEESIQQSAQTSFWSNAASSFVAFLGFVTQLMQYLWAKRSQNNEHGQQNGNPSPKLRLKKVDAVASAENIKAEAEEQNKNSPQD
jgi:hypothetical protein